MTGVPVPAADTPDGAPTQRIDSLTGLRWFAALAVFFSHNMPLHAPAVVTAFMGAGYVGVTVFFILSGFILTVTYQSALQEPSGKATWNFAVARVARVYPLYLLVLLYVMALGTGPALTFGEKLVHGAALQAWLPNVTVAFAANGPGWSVGVEFFLYAMFPLMIVVLRRPLRTPRGATAVAAVALTVMVGVYVYFQVTGKTGLPITDPVSAHRWLYRSPLLRLGDFTLGIAAAAFWKTFPALKRTSLLAPMLAGAATLTIVAIMAVPSFTQKPFTYDLVFAVPMVVLLWALAASPHAGLGRVLSWLPIVWLGEISYAFYLMHMPLHPLVGTVDTFGVNAATARYVGALLIIVAVAAVLHYFVEKPARRYLRRTFERTGAATAARPLEK